MTVEMILELLTCVFFCKQKTAYEVRISDWSSDVCSSDLRPGDDDALALAAGELVLEALGEGRRQPDHLQQLGHPVGAVLAREAAGDEIGRASCRERVCQ